MLEIPRRMVEAIVAHARRDHPDEACGIVTGKDGVAARIIQMQNADRSPTGFTFDSAEWLRVYREVDDADEEFLVVYHSHTMTEAYPSRTDIGWSRTTPFTHWLLVSTRDPDTEEIRSFTISDGEVVEEELDVVGDE